MHEWIQHPVLQGAQSRYYEPAPTSMVRSSSICIFGGIVADGKDRRNTSIKLTIDASVKKKKIGEWCVCVCARTNAIHIPSSFAFSSLTNF